MTGVAAPLLSPAVAPWMADLGAAGPAVVAETLDERAVELPDGGRDAVVAALCSASVVCSLAVAGAAASTHVLVAVGAGGGAMLVEHGAGPQRYAGSVVPELLPQGLAALLELGEGGARVEPTSQLLDTGALTAWVAEGTMPDVPASWRRAVGGQLPRLTACWTMVGGRHEPSLRMLQAGALLARLDVRETVVAAEALDGTQALLAVVSWLRDQGVQAADPAGVGR